MSDVEESYPSDEDFDFECDLNCTPPDLILAAEDANNGLLPSKSRERYERMFERDFFLVKLRSVN